MVDAADQKQSQIQVQVCYAEADREWLFDLCVPAGALLQQAINASGILTQAPQIDLAVARVGIHGKLKSMDTVLRERDRIEIYRCLIADPKDARRIRAASRKK